MSATGILMTALVLLGKQQGALFWSGQQGTRGHGSATFLWYRGLVVAWTKAFSIYALDKWWIPVSGRNLSFH